MDAAPSRRAGIVFRKVSMISIWRFPGAAMGQIKATKAGVEGARLHWGVVEGQ
jgi:hypothetical protein